MKIILSKGEYAANIKKEQLHFENVTRINNNEWRCETKEHIFIFKVHQMLGTLFMVRGETEMEATNAAPIAQVLNKNINFFDIMFAIDCTMDMDNFWDDGY